MRRTKAAALPGTLCAVLGTLCAALWLCPAARAVPREVLDAVPRSAEDYLRDVLPEGETPYSTGGLYSTDGGYGPDSGYSTGSLYGMDGLPDTGGGYGTDGGTYNTGGTSGTGETSGTGRTSGTEEVYGAESFTGGVGRILERAWKAVPVVFRARMRSAASVLLAVALCGGARAASGDGGGMAVPLAGALAVTALSAGSMEELIGLGWKTIRELDGFSRALLPALAAATAAAGSPTAATVQQVLALFLAGCLLRLIDALLMPLTYLYIGVLTASCALPGNRLDLLAELLKRAVSGVLTTALLGFTLYLSVSRVVAGTADSTAVRITRAAVSGMVPVVGGILSEASEAVLAGAGVLRNSIGVFGMLAVLAACVWPFLQLGVQYLLYRGTALLAGAAGLPELGRLLDGLGAAFALVLGMTAACAALLLVSVLTFVSAAVPG